MKPDVSRSESLVSARNLAASGKPSEELQSLEEDLREAREYAEAIVEAAPPLLVLDADLRVKSANESFYRLFEIGRVTKPRGGSPGSARIRRGDCRSSPAAAGSRCGPACEKRERVVLQTVCRLPAADPELPGV